MPIKVSCSSCETKLRVPDTAAGKRIKCPKCGVPTAVPFPVEAEDDESTPPKRVKAKSSGRDRETDDVERPRRKGSKSKSGTNNQVWIGAAIGGVAIMLIGGVVLAVVLISGSGAEADKATNKQGKDQSELKKPGLAKVENAADRPPQPGEKTASETKLSWIGKAFQNYEKKHKHFPMSTAQGKGKLSWRVEILEYLDFEHNDFYKQFKTDEAWDSPHNFKVFNTWSIPWVFQPGRKMLSPDNKEIKTTFYQLFTGPGTCYPAVDTQLTNVKIADRANRTWLVAEGKNPIEWIRPDELVIDGGQVPPLGGVFGVGFYVMTADGKPHYVSRDRFSPQEMLQLVDPVRPEVVQGWPPR